MPGCCSEPSSSASGHSAIPARADRRWSRQAAANDSWPRRRAGKRRKLVEPRENVFFLKGKVAPSYAGEPVSLQRQKCSSCTWRTYTTKDTSSTGHYKFRLPLPKSGSYYFRARVAGDALFVPTLSRTVQLLRIL